MASRTELIDPGKKSNILRVVHLQTASIFGCSGQRMYLSYKNKKHHKDQYVIPEF